MDGERHGCRRRAAIRAIARRHAGARPTGCGFRKCPASRRPPPCTARIARTTVRDSRPKASSRMEPPRIGTAFPILVPQVDADGNGIAGVRMPELAVPLATYTGWNLFNDRSGPTDGALEHAGLVHPARARTSAERKRTSDPRASIEERYRDKDQYVGAGDEGGAGARRSAVPAGRGSPVGREQRRDATGTTRRPRRCRRRRSR